MTIEINIVKDALGKAQNAGFSLQDLQDVSRNAARFAEDKNWGRPEDVARFSLFAHELPTKAEEK